MPASTTLPIMAGLAIVGAALGVGLGRSAISEIDPAYFSDPEVAFVADSVPNASPDWAQVQLAEYQGAVVGEGLGSGCVGCRDYPVEYAPRHDPAVDGYAAAPAPIVYAAAQVEAPVAAEPQPRDPEWERVERYASYQVEQPAPVQEAAVVYAGTE
jgi:hypothetical protein